MKQTINLRTNSLDFTERSSSKSRRGFCFLSNHFDARTRFPSRSRMELHTDTKNLDFGHGCSFRPSTLREQWTPWPVFQDGRHRVSLCHRRWYQPFLSFSSFPSLSTPLPPSGEEKGGVRNTLPMQLRVNNNAFFLWSIRPVFFFFNRSRRIAL